MAYLQLIGIFPKDVRPDMTGKAGSPEIERPDEEMEDAQNVQDLEEVWADQMAETLPSG